MPLVDVDEAFMDHVRETVDKSNYSINLPKETVDWLEYQAKTENVEPQEIVQDMLTDGFTVLYFDTEESVVKMRHVNPWGGTQMGEHLEEVKEDGTETQKNIEVFRSLRESFPPVTAGIEYVKAFTSGSGFDVKIDNPDDKHQVDMKKAIIDLDREIFMDDITIGLEPIMDIMIDDVLTEGVAAAEIVYEEWDNKQYQFEDFATKTTIMNEDDSSEPRWIPKKMLSSDWQEFGGVKQLKPIPNAYHRLKPYRDKRTWKIMYFTVDEEHTEEGKEPIRLLPWQVLWLSWNRRGNSLKGVSMIKPVVETALLLKRILYNIGISFDKWADKKFFFILGDSRTGRSWAPHHIRNFLKDSEKLTKNNATGIAVPAGFDVKDIGGDVYDGGTIIDNLISVICGGMRYPRTFLEQGKTQEGDKAWLAWLVTYSRNQTHLKTAIETQIWKRHLWCKYGMTRAIPKQGVPEEEREVEPIYVPNMEWSSEGRWHREEKLKMLKDWLNVGNPVTPTFKIGIEEDAATTLGYTELSFEAQREQIKIHNEINLLEAKIDKMQKKMQLELLEQFYKDKGHLELKPVLGWAEEIVEMEDPYAFTDTKTKQLTGDLSEMSITEQEKMKEARWDKRKEGGIHRTNKPSAEANKREVAKNPGSTRKPKIGGDTEESLDVEEGRQQVDVNIVVETKSEPIEVKVDTKPQEIVFKDETQPKDINVKVQTESPETPKQIEALDSTVKILNEKLEELEKKNLEDEEFKKRKLEILQEMTGLKGRGGSTDTKIKNLEARVLKEMSGNS